MLFSCCSMDIIENNNNPIAFQQDSILVTYYLTTQNGELSTKFKPNETIIVHYDLTNESESTIYFAHDYVYQYPYLIYGKCYTEKGQLEENTTFYGINFNDSIYSSEDMYPVFTLLPKDCWKGNRSVELCTQRGLYYFEIVPRLRIYNNIDDSIPISILKMPAQKLQFSITNK